MSTQTKASKPTHTLARVLIVTGQNNHDWFVSTPLLKAFLDQARDEQGHRVFDVDIAQSPPASTDPNGSLEDQNAWQAFRPAFGDYQVVVVDYNNNFVKGGDPWPKQVQQDFETYIAQGGKAYLYHAANNAFLDWPAWQQMAGLLWQKKEAGKRVYLKDDGTCIHLSAGEGQDAGHGDKHAFQAKLRVSDHAIFTQAGGLPEIWMHGYDELYHAQRGPAENMTIIASAFCSKDQGGTGKHEPIIWTIAFGDGLVMTNVLGHCGYGTHEPMRAVDFQVLFARSIQWLATGQVTIPAPADYPTATQASYRPLLPITQLTQ